MQQTVEPIPPRRDLSVTVASSYLVSQQGESSLAGFFSLPLPPLLLPLVSVIIAL
jgi:hypothetical protein